MRKLKICVLDLVARAPNNSLYAKVMYANLASIMPQVVATICESEGHDVTYMCYTGRENIDKELPQKPDIVFITAFTPGAFQAYSISNYLRSKGAVTVLGGPHARCYPEDSLKYFDYVFGFTHKSMIQELLKTFEPQKELGILMAAEGQPEDLPGVEERWNFIEQNFKKAPWIKVVPMIGSMGCPYTCSFCIDSVVTYQPMDFDVLKSDLAFLRAKMKRPLVAWHDPNFGIRFNDYMNAIEEAIPENSIDFIAETSLALLSEPHMQRLQKNGFKAILPGIESWYDLGNKSKTGQNKGQDKLEKVSAQVNMMLKYVPYMQTTK